MPRRNPPPPPPRRSGPPSPQRVQTSLARVRQIAKSVSPRDRPFEPGRRGTWQGSSRDLVVNGGLSEADKRVIRAFVDERTADSRLLETDGVKLDKIGLGGETVAVWNNGRIAIISTESVKSDESIIRLIAKVAGPGIVDFSYPRKGHRQHSLGAPGRLQRNGSVDPRDIPAHLRPAEINEIPEHNGQDIGYSQGYRSKREDGWYQVEYATGSDYNGGSVNESNYKELCAMLEEAHPEDSEPVVWARTSGGHGTYGIAVRYGDLDEDIRETLDGLEDYPIINDESHSELEMEQQNEAWERWGVDDLSSAVAKSSGHDPYDVKNGLDDEEWFEIFRLASEKGSHYWEDQQGAGPYIDMKRVAKTVIQLLEKGLPSYATNEQVEAYEKLGHLIGEPA